MFDGASATEIAAAARYRRRARSFCMRDDELGRTATTMMTMSTGAFGMFARFVLFVERNV